MNLWELIEKRARGEYTDADPLWASDLIPGLQLVFENITVDEVVDVGANPMDVLQLAMDFAFGEPSIPPSKVPQAGGSGGADSSNTSVGGGGGGASYVSPLGIAPGESVTITVAGGGAGGSNSTDPDFNTSIFETAAAARAAGPEEK